MQKLSKSNINKKNLLIILSVIFIFLLGGLAQSKNLWPFSYGYYSKLVNIFKYGIHYNIELKKIAKEEERLKLSDIKTLVHNLAISKFNKDYDHISVISEKENGELVEILAVKGNTDIYGTTPSKLKIFLTQINTKKNEVKENLILEIDNNYRATDVSFFNKKNFLVSYVDCDQRNFISLKLVEIKKNDDNYYIEELFQSEYFEPPFGVHQSGGKIIEYDSDHVLIAVGDFQKGYLLDKIDNSNGKIFKINVNNKTKKVFSTGHRNPQGFLYSETLNAILETEHGPEGGDEINEIVYGKNYGWPYDSYGIPYGVDYTFEPFANAGGSKYGSHEQFKKPVYAFIPSIGIKAIEQLPSTQYEFPYWGRNFLICSARGLYRAEIILEESIRLVTHEKLINDACRDLQILSDGRIITNDLRLIFRKKGPRG